MNSKHISLNLVWLLNAIAIAIISFVTNYLNLSSLSYICYNIFYVFIVLYFKYKKFDFSSQLNGIPFLIGTALLVSVTPIFENDFYRYIWEGKVLSSGFNPYIYAPNDPCLSDVKFAEKSLIGFPTLAAIYPPLALVFFSLFSMISSSALIVIKFLGLFNALIIYYLLNKLSEIVEKKYLIFLILPMLSKEFINSVHIDLIAASFIFYLILKDKKKVILEYLIIILSFFTKLIGIIYLYPWIIRNYRKISRLKLVSLLVISIFIILGYIYIIYQFNSDGGSQVFVKHWVWNAGFFSILWRSGVELEISRIICFILLFLINIILILFSFFKLKYVEDNSLKEYSFIVFILFFMNLYFFMPVYNSWYSIWVAIPGIIIGSFWPVFYCSLSFFSYVYYISPDLAFIGEILSHFLYFPVIIYLTKKLIYITNVR